MTEPRYLTTCVVCRGDVPHEAIASVQSGMIFLRCLSCGTVHHVPKPTREESHPCSTQTA